MVTPDQFSARVAAEKPSKIIPRVGQRAQQKGADNEPGSVYSAANAG